MVLRAWGIATYQMVRYNEARDRLGGALVLGDWIKEQRTARKWTQKYLAELVGTTADYIRHLEANRHPDPGMRILQGLARAFGVSVDELIEQTRGAHNAFPATQLRAAGLPEDHITRLARLWERFPEKREALLESAQSLARVHAKHERLVADLEADSGDVPEIDPTPQPVAS